VAEYAELEARLGHVFADPRLLRRALTHPSLAHEQSSRIEHNQRLEFLGDAVLQLVLTEQLYRQFPDRDEGPLTQARAQLANRRSLAAQGRRLGLGGHLILSRGEEATGGRERESSLADAFEAVLGAVYLDAGWETARSVVQRLFAAEIQRLEETRAQFNPKGELQERLQALGPDPIVYRLEDTLGTDHQREFEVSVQHRGVELGRGRGRSKKEAESQAALAALQRLKESRPGIESAGPPSPPTGDVPPA
jgi:ribonuclease-3